MNPTKAARFKAKQRAKTSKDSDDRIRIERDNLRRAQNEHTAQLQKIKSERNHERNTNKALRKRIVTLESKVDELREEIQERKEETLKIKEQRDEAKEAK